MTTAPALALWDGLPGLCAAAQASTETTGTLVRQYVARYPDVTVPRAVMRCLCDVVSHVRDDPNGLDRLAAGMQEVTET